MKDQIKMQAKQFIIPFVQQSVKQRTKDQKEAGSTLPNS